MRHVSPVAHPSASERGEVVSLNRLMIPDGVLAGVIAHARSELPNECCGFLAGHREGETGRVAAAHPLVNELASPTAFLTEARSLFAAYRAMRASGTDVLAVYHSHPTSAPVPSPRDIAENTYGESVAWVIVGLSGKQPEVKAWRLTATGCHPIEWGVG